MRGIGQGGMRHEIYGTIHAINERMNHGLTAKEYLETGVNPNDEIDLDGV